MTGLSARKDRDSAGRRLSENASDVAGVTLASNAQHPCADIHIARTSRLIEPGSSTKGSVLAGSRVICERFLTDSRVEVGVVVIKRECSIGRVCVCP